MTKHAPSPHAPDAPILSDPAAAVGGPFLEVVRHAGDAYAKAYAAWQAEVLRFLGLRLEWDHRVGEALAKCRNLGEIVEVQRDWAMTAAQDYFDEILRLNELASKLVPSWMPMTPTRVDAAKLPPLTGAAE